MQFKDVATLCEIMESRFKFMYKKYCYNPNLCITASTLCVCIEEINLR